MAKPKHRQEGDSPAQAPSPIGTTGRQSIHGDNEDYGDRVAQRAYELYLARGAADGQDFDDWLTAERQLANRHDRGDETGE